MIAKEKIYRLAFEEKRKEKEMLTGKREMLLNAAHKANPRLGEIENNLKAIGAKLVTAALGGNTAELEELKRLSSALASEKREILKKCNVPELTPACPICNDTGYAGGKICDCVKKIAKSITLKELSTAMPIADSTFENFNLSYYSDDGATNENCKKRMTAVFKLCHEYAISFNPDTSENLLFMGAPGLGKTHLTLAIVGEVIAKGYLPIYGPSANIIKEINDEHFGESTGAFEAIANCDLLVLDDLGTEIVTSVSKSILYSIINERLLNKKPTIINTNLSMSELELLYSPRITSRLIGEYNANLFLGNDIRQQKALKV